MILKKRYKVGKKIFDGGFGSILEGTDLKTNKRVAIKKIQPEYSQYCLNEPYCSSKLSHDNIIEVLDKVDKKIPFTKSPLYIIMEYIDGINLAELIAYSKHNTPSLSSQAAVFIINKVLDALDYAHNFFDIDKKVEIEIVHCDISPSNIMIDINGNVKLIDFGIAELKTEEAKPEKDLKRGIRGKISYMSPEQASGESDLDRRSDIFSIGVVLFELLTSKHPWRNKTENTAVMLEHLKTKPISQKVITENIKDPKLQKIISKTLMLNRNDRYLSVDELKFDLKEVLKSTNNTDVEKEIEFLIPKVRTFNKQISKSQKSDAETEFKISISQKRKTSLLKYSIAIIFFIFALTGTFAINHLVKNYDNLFPPTTKISTTPHNAIVFINGKKHTFKGKKFIETKSLKPGTHFIRCTKEGYNDIRNIIHVKSKKEKDIQNFNFTFSVPVVLKSNPPNAWIDLNNKSISNQTNLIFDWPVNEPLNVSLHKGKYSSLENFKLNFISENYSADESRWWSFNEIYKPTPYSNKNVKHYELTGNFWKDLKIKVIPSDAAIFIDNEYPPEKDKDDFYNVKLTIGDHVISIDKEGFSMFQCSISIDENQEEKLIIPLERNVRISAVDNNSKKPIKAKLVALSVKRNGKKEKISVKKNYYTPFRYTFQPWLYTLTFSSTGYYNRTVNFSPIKGQLNVGMQLKSLPVIFRVQDVRQNNLNSVKMSYQMIENRLGKKVKGKLNSTTLSKGYFNKRLTMGLYKFHFYVPGYKQAERIILIDRNEDRSHRIVLHKK